MILNKFTRHILGAAAVLLALSPVSAMADRAMAVCVQAQLAISGFSPGIIDGRIGPRTQAASETVRKNFPEFSDLPELAGATSYDWCRSMGRMDERLSAFWPSRIAENLWVHEDADTTRVRATLNSALKGVEDFFTRTYEQAIVGDFAVLAAETPEVLEREAEARRKSKGSDWKGLFPQERMLCPEAGGLSAVGFRDMLLLCWGEDSVYDAAWQADYEKLLSYALSREYVHALQNDLAGLNARQTLPSGEYTVGPRWLAVGAALVFQDEFRGDAAKGVKEQIVTLPEGAQDLTGLRSDVSDDAGEAVARAAAQLLGERHGRSALFAYFDGLRKAEAWNSSFEVVFGETLEAFEAEFASLREEFASGL